MKQEDKELLLKDLSARFPYGVICSVSFKDGDGWKKKDMKLSGVFTDECYFTTETGSTYSNNFKPYLRPMSSRTEEENDFIQQCMDIVENENYHDGFSPSAWSSMADFVNYCNQHHLDYNGLIGKDLALEAEEGMYGVYDEKSQIPMTEEEIVNKNYDAEQCSGRRWNEEEQKWERAFGVCAICSYMCPQRAEDFAKMGKKEYIDETTGLHYWK